MVTLFDEECVLGMWCKLRTKVAISSDCKHIVESTFPKFV